MNAPFQAKIGDRPATWGLPLAGLFAAGLFAPTILQLAQIWELDPNYSHGYFIAPISLWLAWRVVREHRLPERGEVMQGAVTLGIGLCLNIVGVVLRALPIEFAAMVLTLRGVAVLLGGRPWANRLLFPTFFLAFLFPLPVAETTRLAVWLQDAIAKIGTEVLGWFYFCFRRGNSIHIAGVVDPLYVGKECSGVRQIMAFVAMGTLVSNLGKVGWTRGSLLVLLAAPVAIFANVVRIVLMGVGVVTFGQTWLSTWRHDVPAMFTLPLGIATYFGLVWLITPASARAKPTTNAADGSGRVDGPQASTQSPHLAGIGSRPPVAAKEHG